MKKIVLIFIIIFSISCNNDDDFEPTLNVSDSIFTLDENPELYTVIGTIKATSNESPISYSIVNESVIGATHIDSTTGEIIVANPQVFDYELNPSIILTIGVKTNSLSKNIRVTINLNDIENFLEILSTSKDAFINSNENEWVQITREEYNLLATQMLNVTRIGMSEELYASVENPNPYATGESKTVVNQGADIPSNSYVFACKFFCSEGFWETCVVGTKIKISTNTITDGFIDLGNSLGNIKTNNDYYDTELFFVLKHNQIKTDAVGYLAVYDSKGQLGDIETDLFHHESAGDVNSFSTSIYSNVLMYQGLSTTQKQW